MFFKVEKVEKAGAGGVNIDKEGYISCQGESGSCAFGASRVHYFNYTAAPQPSFEEVVRRVVERDAKIGILPIHNSRSGLIAEPLTILARSDVQIIAEHHQPIRHHLMVNKNWVESLVPPEEVERLVAYGDADVYAMAPPEKKLAYDQVKRSLLSQITAIYSDEQGLKQCDRGLKINLSGAERRLTSCTAKASRIIAHETDAAKLAKHELPAYAAIASEECATMYKNIRLVANINDDTTNTTRYVVVSRGEAKASQILQDVDVKTILAKLTSADLAGFFEHEPELEKAYDHISGEFAFGPSSFKAGQEDSARAKLLRKFIASTPNALHILEGHLSHFDHNDERRLRGVLPTLVRDIRTHDEKLSRAHSSDEGEEALQRLLRTKDYSGRVRSLFVLRARDSKKTTQADLLKALVENNGKPRKDKLDFTVIAELPRPIDGGKDAGLGLVIEADGSLLGTKFKDKKKGGFFGASNNESIWTSDPNVLERVLRDIHEADAGKGGIAKVQVLGTFAKEPGTLGLPKQAAGAKGIDTDDLRGPLATQHDDANPQKAGVLAAVLTLCVLGVATWYAFYAHLIPMH